MLNAHDVTKWFIFKNPELASGYIDENTKVNKLLYFSNMMYRCVENENLFDDDFVAFPNGPVVYSVYRDYRYNGLNSLPAECPAITGLQRKILEIINFVYGNYSTQELIEESHSHSQWKDVEHLIPKNPPIDFENVDSHLVAYYQALYKTYSEIDFNRLIKEKICGNVYYYYKDSFEMTEDIINKLSSFEKSEEPKFLEILNGELVVS